MYANALRFPILITLAAPALLPAATQQNVKLNDPLAVGCYGDVLFLEFSPDATRVVFVADADTDDLAELYSVPADGSSTPVKLNGPLAGNAVFEFQVSSDSSRVVYLAEQDTENLDELYSVPLAGGTPTRLNAALVAGGEVLDFRISADATTVVYRADQDVNSVFELYSVPIDGSASPTVISGPLGTGGDVTDYELALDSTRAVYRADQDIDGILELYSAPLDGSQTAIKLNAAPQAVGSVTPDYSISADSSRVVFRSNLETQQAFELYSAPIDGSGAVKPNPVLPAGGNVGAHRISADSSRVAYLADQDTDEVIELYSVPLDGSASATRLNGTLVAGGSVLEHGISPDSSRVIYRADQDSLGDEELYSVPLDGSAPAITVAPTGVVNGDVLPGFQFSPDANRVVYRADHDVNNTLELYSVPLDGSQPPIKLNGALVAPGGDVRQDFAISVDSARVVYLADQESDELIELYSAPIAGGPGLAKLNATPPPGGDVTDFRIGPAAVRVAHLAGQDTADVTELYTEPLDGSGTPSKLNGLLAEGPFGDVTAFQYGPGGETVLYLADQDTNGLVELYSAPVDGSGGSSRLSADLIPTGDVFSFAVSLDGSRVVYRADQELNNTLEIYSVPLDGSQLPVKLNGPLVTDGDVHEYAISPDSTRVVYRADQDAVNVDELYSVPLDGSAAPVKLNGTLPAMGDVYAFEVSSDSSRVVYRADQDTDNIHELYSVPIDGSAASVRLNAPLVGLQDVRVDFEITPDSSRVVYRADQDTDDVAELYSAPLDAGSAAVKLNAAPVAGGNVPANFQISPDSSRVAYLADQDTDDVFELYVVPVDAAAAPIKLNAALAPDRDVVNHRFGADGGRVLYLADQESNGVNELFSVPVDASAGAIKLSSTPLVPVGAVLADYAVHGERVLYRGVLETENRTELYSRPVDGSLPQVKLNAPLPAGTSLSIQSFVATSDADTALYLGEQDIDDVVELYQVPIDGSAGPIKLHPALGSAQDVQIDFAISPNGSRVVYRANQESVEGVELFASLFEPELSAVTASTGPAAGGNTVTLTGRNFADATEVFFAGRPATSVTFVSSSELRVVVPPNFRIPPPLRGPAQGKVRQVVIQGLEVDVTVSNGAFTSTLAGGYTYLPRL